MSLPCKDRKHIPAALCSVSVAGSRRALSRRMHVGRFVALSITLSATHGCRVPDLNLLAESGRFRPSGAACAKRGSIGQMQISAELVPIPWCGVKAA